MNIKEFESNFGRQDYFNYSDHWIVYFLVDLSGERVYVGKTSSTKLGNRLRCHAKTKDFASYFVNTGPKTEKDAYKLEGAFISMLRPKYNKQNISIRAKEIRYFYEWMTSFKESGYVKQSIPWWVKFAFYGLLLTVITALYGVFGFIGYTTYLAQYYGCAVFSAGMLIWLTFGLIKTMFFTNKKNKKVLTAR